MGIRVAVVLACLLLVGCASTPYANPLTAEQLEALRISDIRMEHLRDGSIDAEKAAKVAALVRARLIERLGVKFSPGKGNAVLVVPLQLQFGERGIKDMARLHIRGKIVGPKLSAKYAGASIGTKAIMGDGRLGSPEELLRTLVNIATADLTQQILCCAGPALKQRPE